MPLVEKWEFGFKHGIFNYFGVFLEIFFTEKLIVLKRLLITKIVSLHDTESYVSLTKFSQANKSVVFGLTLIFAYNCALH